MSNKTQLQTNNEKYASLIETLRGKAAGSGGEDVSAETTAYTEKLETLETAITALETELEGKASGGSGGNIETCTVSLHTNTASFSYFIYTQYIDGTINHIIDRTGSYYGVTSTFENVVCGSHLYFGTSGFIEPAYSVTQGSIVDKPPQNETVWGVTVTSTPNVTEAITVWDND